MGGVIAKRIKLPLGSMGFATLYLSYIPDLDIPPRAVTVPGHDNPPRKP